jgi:hypothetical protein
MERWPRMLRWHKLWMTGFFGCCQSNSSLLHMTHTVGHILPCPSTGYNPGLLLAFSHDIIPWGDIFIYMGCQTVHCVGGVEHRMKPQHIPCEYKALASHRHVYLGSFFLEPEDIQRVSLGAIYRVAEKSPYTQTIRTSDSI